MFVFYLVQDTTTKMEKRSESPRSDVYRAILKTDLPTMLRLLTEGQRPTKAEVDCVRSAADLGMAVTRYLELCDMVSTFDQAIVEARTPDAFQAAFYASALPPFIKARAIPIDLRRVDELALFAAIYLGTGTSPGGKLVRLRHLTGAHGLRPIRVRIVGYGVDKFLLYLCGVLRQDLKRVISAYLARN